MIKIIRYLLLACIAMVSRAQTPPDPTVLELTVNYANNSYDLKIGNMPAAPILGCTINNNTTIDYSVETQSNGLKTISFVSQPLEATRESIFNFLFTSPQKNIKLHVPIRKHGVIHVSGYVVGGNYTNTNSSRQLIQVANNYGPIARNENLSELVYNWALNVQSNWAWTYVYDTSTELGVHASKFNFQTKNITDIQVIDLDNPEVIIDHVTDGPGDSYAIIDPLVGGQTTRRISICGTTPEGNQYYQCFTLSAKKHPITDRAVFSIESTYM